MFCVLSINRRKRTLDIFYLAQLGYGSFYESDIEDGRSYLSNDFDDYNKDYGEHITKEVWKNYYSLDFLLQPATARFWRLPNLRDLPSSGNPIAFLREKPIGHHNKLPCWADNVVRTFFRQRELSEDTLTQIAMETLRDTISRLREKHPEAPPFSETQSRFWLKYTRKNLPFASGPNYFGIFVAQGGYDVWEWDRWYSPDRWHSESDVALEPDLDGSSRCELGWCGWPDGGAGSLAKERGWVPEIGSEEEVEFMAAVAARETEGCNLDSLNYSLRSHILLGILKLVFLSGSEREDFLEKIKRDIIQKGRLDETNVDEWIDNAVAVMQPYTSQQNKFPATEGDRTLLFRRALTENGQLFARGGWKFSKRGPARGFKFDLEIAAHMRKK